MISQLAASGLKVVDLSADFRLKNPADYELWYGFKHPDPELLAKFVYAVPELNREEISKTSLAASPGCMAITSILAMAPLFKQKEVRGRQGPRRRGREDSLVRLGRQALALDPLLGEVRGGQAVQACRTPAHG